MPTVDREGVRIHYEATGSGPPILLSHGYSATSEMFDDQVEVFRSAFKVITWDMRGHGHSDYPEDAQAYSEALTVEDMAAILDACEAEQAVVGGLSLGGYMSLAFHLKYPKRVRALMLFDTGPGYKNDGARQKWNESTQRWIDTFEAEGLKSFVDADTGETRYTAHRSVDGLIHAARGMLQQSDARIIESLPAIEVPALVLVGAEDTPFLPPAEYMARKIPGAEKVVITNAGHVANVDQPEAFNDSVMQFLNALP